MVTSIIILNLTDLSIRHCFFDYRFKKRPMYTMERSTVSERFIKEKECVGCIKVSGSRLFKLYPAYSTSPHTKEFDTPCTCVVLRIGNKN